MTNYITSYSVMHDDSQVTGSIMHIVTYNAHSIMHTMNTRTVDTQLC